ncbi:MAG: cytochrome b [Betaproteobacteria bacterium]
MSSTNNGAVYSSPRIWLHWLMLALIALAYALMELKSFAPRGSAARLNMALLHYLTGLLVLLLVWPRLLLRLLGKEPAIPAADPAWQTALARVVHWFLYVLMIFLPLLGWLTLSAAGKPVHIFFFDLPFLLSRDDGLARFLKELHESFATFGYFLIGLHAAGALFHHYVKRDDTLRRMLGSRFPDRL